MTKSTKTYSYVKLRSETLEKIKTLSKGREEDDQIVRNNSAMVTSLVNEAFDAEIAKK